MRKWVHNYSSLHTNNLVIMNKMIFLHNSIKESWIFFIEFSLRNKQWILKILKLQNIINHALFLFAFRLFFIKIAEFIWNYKSLSYNRLKLIVFFKWIIEFFSNAIKEIKAKDMNISIWAIQTNFFIANLIIQLLSKFQIINAGCNNIEIVKRNLSLWFVRSIINRSNQL